MKNMNSRRQFLKVGAAGAVGLALGSVTKRSGIVLAQETGTFVAERNLFADAGMVGEFNSTLDQVIAPTWWDVTTETRPLLMSYLLAYPSAIRMCCNGSIRMYRTLRKGVGVCNLPLPMRV